MEEEKEERRPPRPLTPTEFDVALQIIIDEFAKWVEDGGQLPRFRLPPTAMMVFGRLDVLGEGLCGNDAARELHRRICEASRPRGATLRMLEQVLDMMGYPTERMTEDDLRKMLAPLGPAVTLMLERKGA